MSPYAWIDVAAVVFCMASVALAVPPAGDADWLSAIVIGGGFLMWGFQGMRAREFPVSYVRRGFAITRGTYAVGAAVWGVMLAAICGLLLLGAASIPMAAAAVTSVRCAWLYWEAARAAPRTDALRQ